ncbi:MAG TPA: hypothetical protein VFR34_01745 [Paracoccaceae bacterium]|nr:hypothetical protein [Paracoccaceae bacterium]
MSDTPGSLLPEHVSACRHYANRALFKPRGPGEEFVVKLADSCRTAMARLGERAGLADEAAASARAYLDRLVAFKALIIGMNVARLYGAEPEPRAMPLSAGAGQAVLVRFGNPVSATGEYLIAREFGLLDAYRDWVRAGPRLAGPALPPR